MATGHRVRHCYHCFSIVYSLPQRHCHSLHSNIIINVSQNSLALPLESRSTNIKEQSFEKQTLG